MERALENLQYLSVMTPAVATGVIGLKIETWDLANNITITTTVTGMSASASCESIAAKANNFLLAACSAATALMDTIVFSSQARVGKFNITRTDHVVCVSSQCEFELSVTSNTTGAIIKVGPDPVNAKLSDVLATGDIETSNCKTGSNYTDDELCDKIARASALLTAHLNNNIVQTTYIQSMVGDGNAGVYTEKRPLVAYFTPVFREKFMLRYPLGFMYPVSKDMFNIGGNYIEYNQYQMLVDRPQPFNEGNEAIIVYVAGYNHIPAVIKEFTAKFSYFLINDGATSAASLDGISEDTRSFGEILAGYTPFLRKYFLR